MTIVATHIAATRCVSYVASMFDYPLILNEFHRLPLICDCSHQHQSFVKGIHLGKAKDTHGWYLNCGPHWCTQFILNRVRQDKATTILQG